MNWCLPPERVEQVLSWSSMPRELWESLCIPHRIAVVELWLTDDTGGPEPDVGVDDHLDFCKQYLLAQSQRPETYNETPEPYDGPDRRSYRSAGAGLRSA